MELASKNFKRDDDSGALISTDMEGLAAYKQNRERNRQLANVTNDINSLKSELSEMKDMLKTIIELKQ